MASCLTTSTPRFADATPFLTIAASSNPEQTVRHTLAPSVVSLASAPKTDFHPFSSLHR